MAVGDWIDSLTVSILLFFVQRFVIFIVSEKTDLVIIWEFATRNNFRYRR